MVRTIGSLLPAEWEDLWNKVVRWYGLRGIPTFSRLWFQDLRRMREIRYSISHFMELGTAWTNLSDATRQAWRDAANACWDYNRGYRLFTADYIYRLIGGLPLPGIPSNYHQLFGLELLNPGGAQNVFMRRDDKDIIGQLTYKVKFKKTEITPSGVYAFKVQCTAYYLIPGGYATDTDEYVASAGNIAWSLLNRTFGTADREYFHFKIILTIENYDVIVDLDSIELIDQNGRFFKETWITKRNKAWVPKLLFRKTDWIFSPGYIDTYFKHLYLT